VSRVISIGGQLISIGAGVRYWAHTPDAGPEGFGFRFVIVPLFPR
jgi:hypothetical protein